jgi:hypothetical protein
MLRALTEAFSRGQRALACSHAMVSKKLVGSPVTTEAQRPGKRLARLRVSAFGPLVCVFGVSLAHMCNSEFPWRSHRAITDRGWRSRERDAGCWIAAFEALTSAVGFCVRGWGRGAEGHWIWWKW